MSHRAAIVFFSDDVAQSVFAVTQGVLVSPPIALHALRHVPQQLLGKTVTKTAYELAGDPNCKPKRRPKLHDRARRGGGCFGPLTGVRMRV